MSLHGRKIFLKEHLFLAKETFLSFQKLNKLSIENGFNLQIISGFRSYDAQLKIWNNKASGQRDLYDASGNKINFNRLTKKELLEVIMFYSAIPGFSRHHWGTDIDVFDASVASKENVMLLPNESEPGGIFFDFHQWLDSVIKKENSFGFFRPYDIYNGGVSAEKWHLSYYPLAKQLEKQLTIDLFINEIKNSEILLKDELLIDPEFYFKKFVVNTESPPWLS